MKALVYHSPGSRSWDDVPDPEITAPTDIVMRVDAVTICGTGLHILNGVHASAGKEGGAL